MTNRIIFAPFIFLLAITTISCKKNAAIQNKNNTIVVEQDKILDSLEVDLNQDGKLDNVLVLESGENTGRIVKILLKTDQGYDTIGYNAEIIDCAKCGYQAGDPFINIEKRKEGGFDIMLENSIYSFFYSSNQVVLDKIDLLQTKQSSDGIEEIHEIFTSVDFGVLQFNNIKSNLITKLLEERNKLQSSKNLASTTVNSFIIAKDPLKTALPFSFYEYFKSEYSKNIYPSYEPTLALIEFLKSKDYEGQSYKCFVIRSDETSLYLVASILRGDSEYFVLVTIQNNKIIDYSEIGSIGNENPTTFKVSPDYIIEKYEGNGPNLKPTEKLKIDRSGKIQKFK